MFNTHMYVKLELGKNLPFGWFFSDVIKKLSKLLDLAHVTPSYIYIPHFSSVVPRVCLVNVSFSAFFSLIRT